MKNLIIWLRQLFCDIEKNPVTPVATIQPDYSVYKNPNFRVITEYGNYHIEKWVPNPNDKQNGGAWIRVIFDQNGSYNLAALYWEKGHILRTNRGTQIATKEFACLLLKELLAGKTYFEFFDEVKFAVVDCDCHSSSKEIK